MGGQSAPSWSSHRDISSPLQGDKEGARGSFWQRAQPPGKAHGRVPQRLVPLQMILAKERAQPPGKAHGRVPHSGDDGKYHVIALKDGGGLPSTLDWQVPPPSAVGDPLQAVRQALWNALPQDSLARMKSVMHSGTVAPFFQTIEVETLQRAICGALDIDPVWALQDFELTPYKFHLLSAVALRMGDIDAGLCDTLKVGAPTGVRERIPPSWGVACKLKKEAG